MFRRTAAALIAALGLTAPQAHACGIELVLAIDVSRSVINAEYRQQVNGLAAAFRDPEVVEAVRWVPGGVAATLLQWSGPLSQHQSVPWRLISNGPETLSFAGEIAATRRQFYARYTAVGDALWVANSLSATNPWRCQRRVIDVSGDGASNRGRDPGPISQALAANGVTVNALVIQGAKPDPVEYYNQNVIAGTGAFIEIASSFDDYASAIKRKLLRELTPALASR